MYEYLHKLLQSANFIFLGFESKSKSLIAVSPVTMVTE